QPGDQVEAVEMDLERFATDGRSLEELLGDIRVSRDREQRREHVHVRRDSVEHRPGLYPARPAQQTWNAPATVPVRVLLAAEWRVRPVGPRVVLRPVVGGVHDERV